MSKVPKKADQKTRITIATIHKLRASNVIFQDFVKAAQSYQKQAAKLAEAGQVLSAALYKISQTQTGDLQEGLLKLSEIHRNVENKRAEMSRLFGDELIASLQKSVAPDKAELDQFDADFKKVQQQIIKEERGLEAQTKKAGKKGPEALKQSIANLNQKVKENEQLKAEKLRNVFLLERKKYCAFLTNYLPVISKSAELHQEGSQFSTQQNYFQSLASSNQNLPGDIEELIKEKERTLIAIQSETGGNQGYDYGGYEDYGYGGGSSYDDLGAYSGGGGGGGGYTVTALYDYAGEQQEDLPFYAGDVITVTKEDDGSGWLEGELRGRVGIFPASYVQYN